ncbi:hypothetical protein [Paenibacillus qinlingensis]|uniref:DUF455 family protein n=1 Tax=Paenibacillus qinlingensis TaxID=1837343 RepID=A0ABU1P0C9_9BACL|nr:hypothetical protein [Paenibacillus qinlingensis]MDR6553181.1 hypothetical protein [Paenibacillus qinlingensis]
MRDEKDFEGLQQSMTTEHSFLKNRFLRPVDTSNELKHLLWQELALSKLIGGWIPAIPVYEHKIELGRLCYVHNRNVKCLYERIEELPGGMHDKDWMPDITREAFERMFGAPDEHAFLISYLYIHRQLYAQYDALVAKLDPVLNAPTLDQIKIIFIEREATQRWLHEQLQFVHCSSEEGSRKLVEWERYIKTVWAAFRANAFAVDASAVVWPANLVKNPAGPLPEKAKLESKYPRYTNPKPQQSYTDTSMSVLHDSVKQMIYIYATEIFAGETLSCIYYYVDRMPLPFYFDLARHMWDEFRHSQMGMRRLLQMGHSVDQFQWLGGPGKQDVKEHFTELYANLTMLGEACGFKKKRKSAEAFWKFGDVLSAITCEFDLIDERRHIDFSVRWGPELFKKADMIITYQEMAEKTRIRRLTELDSVPAEEIAKLAKNFPIFCSFHTSELAYHNY